MKDRVSLYPGRVLITPEDGSAPYHATLTRADEPTQEGTPLNKASLLTDATAALYGLTSEAVPDDVFNSIVQSLFPCYARVSIGTYDGTGTSGSYMTLNFDFDVKILFIGTSSATGNVMRNADGFGIIYRGMTPNANINSNYKGYIAQYGYLCFYQGTLTQDENCYLVLDDDAPGEVKWMYNLSGKPTLQFNRVNSRYYYIALG